MFCARCDKPLKDRDAAPVDVARPTGAGLTLYVHRYLCRKPVSQTAPESRRRLVRGR
jgi:hypothetical protein